MKKNINIYFFTFIIVCSLVACNKQLNGIHPLNYIDQQGELSDLPGIIEATNGGYQNLQNTAGGFFDVYEMVLHNISEFRGNNVGIDITLVPLKQRDAFNYTNSGIGSNGYGEALWRESYQIIVGINSVLGGIRAFRASGNADALSADQQMRLAHAEGENYFLRGFAYFNLVRVFGMPYYNNPGTNLGVMIKNDDDPKNIPGRSTVQDTYAQIISDLQQAANLMRSSGDLTNANASVGAAWALLSRVYLYMGGTLANPDQQNNQQASLYADSVINGGQYTLLQGQDYVNMFAPDDDGSLGRSNSTGNSEFIFAFDHSNGNSGWCNSFYHYINYYGSLFGGVYPSPSYQAFLAPGDLRNNFLQPNPDLGKIETTKYDVNLDAWFSNAPYVFIRLAEVYLNRAEAKAKLGDDVDALADLNSIHQRAGLSAITGVSGAALEDSILLERRMELAFEGFNSYDDFRNGLPMVRPASDTGGAAFIIQPDDPKVVMRIPFDDITTNPKLKQNNQ